MEKTVTKAVKDPLFHIVRRDTITTGKTIAIKVIALLLAFIVSSIILGISEGCDPFTFLASLFMGSFGASLNIWILLKDMAILLGLGLALLPAFKMKFWNTGADGQALIAALASYMCLYFMRGKVNDILLIIICLLAAVTAGIIWAVIPAIFKAFWNTNETLFTLMMNYVAIQCVAVFINKFATGGSNTLPTIYEGSLGMIYEYLTPILIVALLTAAIAVYLKKTKHGFELSLVGESVNSARYVGINVKKVIIRTLIVSGAICGLIGFILTNGLNHVVNTNSLGGKGFTAIIVVWLADFNPYFMILSSFMIVFLQRGTIELLSNLGATNDSITSIVTSIFIFFIIGCTFFSRYKVLFRRDEEGKIDNKFFAFFEKILSPIARAITKAYQATISFFKNLFKSKKKDTEIDNNDSKEITLKEDNNTDNNVEAIQENNIEETNVESKKEEDNVENNTNEDSIEKEDE